MAVSTAVGCGVVQSDVVALSPDSPDFDALFFFRGAADESSPLSRRAPQIRRPNGPTLFVALTAAPNGSATAAAAVAVRPPHRLPPPRLGAREQIQDG